MGFETKLAKHFSRIEKQKLGASLLAGVLLVSLALFILSQTKEFDIAALNVHLSTSTNATNSQDQNATMVLKQNGSSTEKFATKKYQDKLEEKIYEYTARDAKKKFCDFSEPKTDVCDLHGDIRVHGSSSSVLIINSITHTNSSQRDKSWKIKPHPRKFDAGLMSHIKDVSIKLLENHGKAPYCAINHSVPAIIFSIGGYMGNYFHDFSDILIPLSLTSHNFQGEVQFLVSDMKPWWVGKYKHIFDALSKYEVIDFNHDTRIHCYSNVILGLRSHKEMSIDPSKSQDKYSMIDFAKFLRKSYSLPRNTAIRLSPGNQKKPRLMIIARSRTRTFTNAHEIARVSEELGFETVIAEADFATPVKDYAEIVNSCDVMVGVHGAGLTNFVFLPLNAIVIQVIPLGRLEGIAWGDFGAPTWDLGLRYLEYKITKDESSLIGIYPRRHKVFKDPMFYHKQGWLAMGAIYLDKQNVTVHVERFRVVLLEALKLLH